MADQDLYEAASELLQACQAILRDACPARCYINPGQPADDTDEYLAVWADPIDFLDPFGSGGGSAWGVGEMQQVAGLSRTTLNIRIMRKAAAPATRGRPQLSDIDRVAQRCYADVWRLSNGIRRRIEAEALLVGLTASFVGSVTATTESGLIVGWQLIVQATLDGYAPEEGS